METDIDYWPTEQGEIFLPTKKPYIIYNYVCIKK